MFFGIGIDNYDVSTGFNQLRFASRDLECMSSGLFDQTQCKINLKGHVTRSEFINRFVSWLAEINEGTAVFYFAGHAYCNSSGTNLVFSDSVGGGALEITSIQLSMLFKLVCEKPMHFLFLIDACREKHGALAPDFSPPNVTVVHTTAPGKLRYEFPAISKSLPAVIHSALPAMQPQFLLTELIEELQRVAELVDAGDFYTCSSCGDRLIDADIFSRNSSWFDFDNVVEWALIVRPDSELSRREQENLLTLVGKSLTVRYNAFFDLSATGPMANDPCMLNVTCQKAYYPLVLEFALEHSGEQFSGFQVTYSNKVAEAIQEGIVEELPKSSQAERLFLHKGHQYSAKKFGNFAVLHKLQGNTGEALSSKPLIELCNDIKLI